MAQRGCWRSWHNVAGAPGATCAAGAPGAAGTTGGQVSASCCNLPLMRGKVGPGTGYKANRLKTLTYSGPSGGKKANRLKNLTYFARPARFWAVAEQIG